MKQEQYKIYVSVEILVDTDGQIIPKAIIWEDGKRFEIDKILDVRPAASMKAGGIGTRYLCRINSKDRYLFFEDPRWFVEARQ